MPDQGRTRQAGALGAARAVFWAFFGVRRRGDHEHDVVTLAPGQVIIAGIIAGVLFVASLVLIVLWVTA
jgi:hypothetical protein